MFLGHFAVGMAAKNARPKLSLPLLLVASQFLDLLWPTLLLLGLEHVEIANEGPVPLIFSDYPISHGLFFVFVWGLIVGVVYNLLKRDQASAIILGLLVVSHWFLDLIVHNPDLPVLPGRDTRLGLGLWNYKWATVVLELAFFTCGIYLYTRAKRAAKEIVSVWFWILIGLLVLVQASDLFGPPPEDATAIGWMAQLQWLFILLAWLADRKKTEVKDAVVNSRAAA